MASKKYTEDQVIKALKTSKSWSSAASKIGLKYAGGNIGTLKKIAKIRNVNTDHFTGQGWNKGGIGQVKITNNEMFVVNSKVSQSRLKTRILKFNLIEYKCKKCNSNDMWVGEKIVLHLDHINGISSDNRLENLRFLCPNCHSQTKTYCRKKETNLDRLICKKCGCNIFRNKTGMCTKCFHEARRSEIKKARVPELAAGNCLRSN